MFSAFLKGSAASGHRLCNIARVYISVAKSLVKKLGSTCMTKINRLQSRNPVYFPLAGTFQFLTRDLPTTNSNLSISHSPLPLATGSIRNAKNVESLLTLYHGTRLRPLTMRHEVPVETGNIDTVSTRDITRIVAPPTWDTVVQIVPYKGGHLT